MEGRVTRAGRELVRAGGVREVTGQIGQSIWSTREMGATKRGHRAVEVTKELEGY